MFPLPLSLWDSRHLPSRVSGKVLGVPAIDGAPHHLSTLSGFCLGPALPLFTMWGRGNWWAVSCFSETGCTSLTDGLRKAVGPGGTDGSRSAAAIPDPSPAWLPYAAGRHAYGGSAGSGQQDVPSSAVENLSCPHIPRCMLCGGEWWGGGQRGGGLKAGIQEKLPHPSEITVERELQHTLTPRASLHLAHREASASRD